MALFLNWWSMASVKIKEAPTVACVCLPKANGHSSAPNVLIRNMEEYSHGANAGLKIALEFFGELSVLSELPVFSSLPSRFDSFGGAASSSLQHLY